MEKTARFREKFDGLVKKIIEKGFTISEVEISVPAFECFEKWTLPVPLNLQRHWLGIQAVVAFHPPGIKTRQFRRVRG